MPKTTKTTVSRNRQTGQYILRIPVDLADAQGFGERPVCFNILSENTLEMKEVKENSDRVTRAVSQDSEGYYKTTLPKAIGDGMKLDGEKVDWRVTGRKSLKLSRINGE